MRTGHYRRKPLNRMMSLATVERDTASRLPSRDQAKSPIVGRRELRQLARRAPGKRQEPDVRRGRVEDARERPSGV
jgi:hypothetical protein